MFRLLHYIPNPESEPTAQVPKSPKPQPCGSTGGGRAGRTAAVATARGGLLEKVRVYSHISPGPLRKVPLVFAKPPDPVTPYEQTLESPVRHKKPRTNARIMV